MTWRRRWREAIRAHQSVPAPLYDALVRDRNRLFASLFYIAAHPEEAEWVAKRAMSPEDDG